MERLNMSEQQQTDLFDYIAGQQATAEPESEAVNLDDNGSPDQSVSAGSSENVHEASAGGSTPTGVTPGAGTTAVADTGQSQQELETLRQQNERVLGALAMLAAESRRREEKLFEASLENLSDEEQQARREQRRIEQIESENALLRAQQMARQRSEVEAQEQVDKGLFAHTVINRLGLQNDAHVLGLLMESSSPAEMVYTAQRLARVNAMAGMADRQNTATQVAQQGVHAAGGESAPAVAPKKTPQRSGNLIDMMRERSYQAEPVNR